MIMMTLSVFTFSAAEGIWHYFAYMYRASALGVCAVLC